MTTNGALARSYLTKARVRLLALAVFLAEEAYSDVIREAQELVELALKGMLRQVGVEPPHWHDVGSLFGPLADRFPELDSASIQRIATVSAWLQAEREPSFYGEVDLIPAEHYTAADAQRAFDDASWGGAVADRAMPEE